MEKKDSPVLSNLVLLVRALFCQTSSRDILDGTLFFDDISFRTAADYMMLDPEVGPRYSRLECTKIAESANDFIEAQQFHHISGDRVYRGCLSVFSILTVLAELILKPEEPVVCRYEQLVPWRQLSRDIGEDLLVATMYAKKDLECGVSDRKSFSWSPVLKHDNTQLNFIMQRGISDHHFHLFASLPYFQLSWINLMNDVSGNVYLDNLRRIEQQNKVWRKNDPVTKMLNHHVDKAETSILILHHLQAALIRVYLFCRLTEDPAETSSVFGRLQRVYALLRSDELLQMYSTDIEDEILFLQGTSKKDYALSQVAFTHHEAEEKSSLFAGERWFLYAMLRDISAEHNSQKLSREEHNLFYAYLCLKNELRMLMVQVNNYVGFDNFQRYERRRGYFVPPVTESQRLSAQLAVRDLLMRTPYLQELEVRISPSGTAEGNYQWISRLDNAICGDPETAGLKSRFYYVYHFIKRKDTGAEHLPPIWNDLKLRAEPWQYRHHKLRGKLEQQSKALMAFRESYPETASRIRGIDAASQEIECRPEVFAPIFRLLSLHQPIAGTDEESPLPHLKITYHAGEDFLDVVDGLRAIDEAIRFLGLHYGDRLGHAIALGIDVADWYHNKKYQIVLSKQDYIDNLAWMYHALTQYHLDTEPALRKFLQTEFDRYFREVYLMNLSDQELENILQAGAEYNQRSGNRFVRHQQHCQFDIEIYYKAWTLRGDHPYLYRNGYYEAPVIPIDEMERHQTNFAFPQPFEDRFIPECAVLYYEYHYNPAVKSAGIRQITVPVSRLYQDVCIKIQRCMQREVASRGIFVETNPSSNVLISTFREYQKHPMYHFYNKHLVPDDKENGCEQLHISINTDDNGVFYTSIENEFALVARATELICSDTDDSSVYKKSDIYEWIDDIRKMGNEQGFTNQ